jgi:hypothetical protein
MSNDSSANGDYPRNWRFDEDGPEVAGRFAHFDEGITANGTCPIVVLEVDDEKRSVWLFHTAARSRFADEVARRESGNLKAGELISIRQGETKTGGNGRAYTSYVIRFPEAPKRSPKEILGPSLSAGPEAYDEPPEPDAIPY